MTEFTEAELSLLYEAVKTAILDGFDEYAELLQKLEPNKPPEADS